MVTKKGTIFEEKKIDFYIANDGTKFKSRNDCLEYEQQMSDKRLKESPDVIECEDAEEYMPFNGEEYYENHTFRWFKPLNKNGIELLNEVFGDIVDNEYIGEWTCLEISDDDVYTTRLSNCIEYVKTVLGKLGEKVFLQPTAFEVCSRCGKEIALNWDVNEDGYNAFCPYCGEKIVMCGACQSNNGDGEEHCDYDKETDACCHSGIDAEYEYILNYAAEGTFDYENNTELKTLRVLWTAYCLHRGYDADTANYDSGLSEIYSKLGEKTPEFEEKGFDKFDRYMCKYLV